jgi:BlaI family penicillinase repressor
MTSRAGKTSRPPRLSEAEWTIMKPFWERGALAARDLFAALPSDHRWAYKTVKTMLARLVKKGALEYTQVGNSYLYQARVGQEDMVGAAVKNFSHRVLDGAFEPFLVHFFEGRDPSADEISTLRGIIKQLKEKQTQDNEKKVRNKKS